MTGPAANQPLGTRIATTIGPEAVATILSIAVVLAVATLILGQSDGSSGNVSQATATAPVADTPAPGASKAAVAPSDGRDGSDDPGSSSAGPSPAPWAPIARTMLQAERRLIGVRRDLIDELDTKPRQADDLAEQLRSANQSLGFALDRIAELRAAGFPKDVADNLQELHAGANEASLRTLEASISNARAYRAGAQDVVDELEGLEALMRQLASESGLPPPDVAPAG